MDISPKSSPKPFLVRQGEAFCRGCDRWLPLDDFYADRNPKANRHGKRIRCKQCETAKRREWYQSNRDKARTQVRTRKRNATKAAQRADGAVYAASARKRTLIELTPERLEVLQGHIRHLVTRHGELELAAFESSVPARRLRELLNAPRPNIEPSTVERILIAADAMGDLSLFEPEPGLEGWSRKGHRFCQDCGTWHHPHCARGLCERCYMYQMRHPGQLRSEGQHRKGIKKYWAQTAKVDECVVCHRSDRRHHSNGWCEACFQRTNKRRVRFNIPRDEADMMAIAMLPPRVRTQDIDISTLRKQNGSP